MSKVLALGGSIVTRLCEGQFGITRREWSVLAVLARAPKMTWKSLATQSGLDKSRLSRGVTSLVQKELARKTYLADRQLILEITDKGRALYAELFPLARQVNLGLLQDLDAETLACLDAALVAMHERAQALAAEMPLPKAERRLGRQR
ncbi:MarR family transcriptional regulator [Achromobacter sp. GG226]|uniref:MarR family winged helix-turn-helix transcriptional regulator n=1 Tax=Verticiella alkaliphila TaxID=2779529 RepID=UPI001C0E4AE3|nr:MarR family transcriptional regulator [Verticiella sp. GG226]MBU4610677.1 MarR family transcriptional regulator [Verticiella sp. GG226]